MARYCNIDQLHASGVKAEALSKFQPAEKWIAIEGASGKMSSYLKKVFTLPLVAVGTDLVRCCAIIAAYDLLSSKGLNPEGVDDNFRLRYEGELKWLLQVADGDVIADATGTPPDASAPAAGRPRVISSESRGYSVRGSGYSRGPFQTS